MLYITVIATKPGNPPAKIEKRTADSKVFQLECSSLLAENELIFGSIQVNSPILKITEVKPKLGKHILFRVDGGPTDVPHEDYKINFMVHTSNNSELSIPINIRVYSN